MPPYGALSGSPSSRPIATPVSAAWPSAALKNAIRRVTTRWLTPPRIGASTSTQRKPRTRNGYWKSLGQRCRAAPARRSRRRSAVIARTARIAGSSSSTLAVARIRRPSATTRRSSTVTRSATRRTCSRSCDTISTVVRPRALQRQQDLVRGSRTAASSRPAVGSSRSSSSGSGSSAWASSTRRSSPPDSTASGPLLEPGQADPLEQARDRDSRDARVTPRQTGRRCRVSARKSATVTGSVGSTAKLCGT